MFNKKNIDARRSKNYMENLCFYVYVQCSWMKNF